MEKLDYKKEYKDLYQPSTKPTIVQVPEMAFFAVEGSGNPNTCKEYQEAMEILYGLSFTVKMSKMNGTQPEGYFEYVVPPLEGLCVQMMHKGPYDNEPDSIAKIKDFVLQNGYVEDFTDKRFHHEIYLSDPRKCAPERLRTVIRHPIKKKEDTVHESI